jgi:raffinose/stachyose/melibiose transport system permease protein
MVIRKGFGATGIFFILPILCVAFIFFVFPITQTFYYSFTDWKGTGSYKFTGWSNYLYILDSKSFVASLKRTIIMGIAIAIISNVLGLLIAIVANQAFRSKNMTRTLFYIPKLFPIVLAAYVWGYILHPSGLLNLFLSSVFNEPIKILWIDSPNYVVYSIIGIAVWQLVGPIMIVYLAALQGVPNELIEASIVDGAGPIRKFFNVVLPLIAPGITINTLVGLVNGLRLFDLPFALTRGGPANASETLAIRIYKDAFDSLQLGYGMAGAFILVVIIMMITLGFIYISRKYEGSAYH